MTKAERLWWDTHPDFRTVIDGVRYVMRCGTGGGVELVRLEDLV